MRKIPRLTLVIAAMAGAMAATLAGCRKAEAPPTPDVVLVSVPSLPTDPADDAWSAAPEHVARLLLQDLVDPRLMEPSTGQLRVQALSDGGSVAFRLRWNDPTADDLVTSATFADACAIQFPAKVEPTLPAPQMGEKGRPVEITYWSAAWQAVVDRRGDTLKDFYPNATVDHYPFEAAPLEPGSPQQQAMAARYAPARALGNAMAGPRRSPVQELIAEGPGTLHPAPSGAAEGRGQRTEDGWAVVLTRPLPQGFQSGLGTQVAFAVWDGSHQEAGSRKMRTGWIPLVGKE
jgi:hypothetical protein